VRAASLIDEPGVTGHAASKLGENINPMRRSIGLHGQVRGACLREPFGCLTEACIKGGQAELPGVTTSPSSPPHPQGAQEKGEEKDSNAGE
jgi:hypothetical protein